MKKIAGLLFLVSTLCAQDAQEVQEDKTQQYKDKKAHEAIIHDTYDEAMKLENVPQAYTDLVKQFGLDPDEIIFYTAVRMNRFVEKVGNFIVLLHPNFFLYLTEQEQLAYIAIQLAHIKAGDNTELGGKHDPEKRTVKGVQDCSLAMLAAFIAGMHYQDISGAAQEWWPTIQKFVYSKTGAVIIGLLVLNALLKGRYTQHTLKRFLQRELESVDVMGAQGLISAREKQVHWGKRNASWLEYQWSKLKGLLFLDMNPEVELGRIKDYVAQNEA